MVASFRVNQWLNASRYSGMKNDYGVVLSPDEFFKWARSERSRGIRETGPRLEAVQEIAIAVAPGGQLVDAEQCAT